MDSSLRLQPIQNHSTYSDLLSQELLSEMEKYSHIAQALGHPKAIFSEKARQQFDSISDDKKVQIIRFLKIYSQFSENCELNFSQTYEKSFLTKILEHYGLEADQRLIDTIDKDTVVEVYSEDMVQLYRSFKMLDMTSYSLLDLSLYEWFVLWERPQLIIQQMQTDIAKTFQERIAFKSFDVTPHLLRETLNTGLTEPFIPKNSYVSFQHIGILKRTKLNAPKAFICTAKGHVVAEGFKETSPIAFL